MGVLALVFLFGLVQFVKAHEGMEMAKMPVEFDQVKALAGTWKGTTEMEGKPMDVKSTFELTSGGSVVMERLFVGTPKEMISMYHADNGKLVMTHYCSMGNQPKMSLKKNSDKELDFEMKGTSGIGSTMDAHMHAMNIVWKDKNHITESWTMYGGGKKQQGAVFDLARIK